MRRLGENVTGKTLDIGAGLKPFKEFFKSSEYIAYIALDADASLKPDVVGDILNLPFGNN